LDDNFNTMELLYLIFKDLGHYYFVSPTLPTLFAITSCIIRLHKCKIDCMCRPSALVLSTPTEYNKKHQTRN